MKKTGKMIAIIAAALVLGVVVGQVATGIAAPARTQATTTSATAGGLGLRLGPAMRGAGGRLVDVVAKLTGQTTDEVQAKRAEGDSFSAIAKDAGVASTDVVDHALAVRKKVLAEQVAAGAITQAQADDALARMQTGLTDRVESTDACTGVGGGCGAGAGGGACGAGGGRRMGAGGAGGACGSGACGQAPAAQ